ncbi:MAG: DUF4143 domain-containing protein [Acidimicrobiia bacterium]|nr:DUF4143 domain-containing protein [Acidimicrobiia bacterium]
MTYLTRHADKRLKRLLEVHPALLIEGIRGVGKTRTATRLAAATLRLDNPAVAAMVATDAEAAFANLPRPLLIDEWQRVPTVWDSVRRMIDDDRTPGRFILSGSTRAAVTADIHAGAGRILTTRLRPMTLSERRGTTPTVSLSDLAEHGIDAVRGAQSTFSPEEQIAPTVESGLPGYLDMHPIDHQEAIRSYLDLAMSRDISEVTSSARNTTKLRGYLRSYAATVGTNAEHSAIQTAAEISKASGESYHDLLNRIGMIEELPGWSNHRLKRLTKRPKRHLVDPAFAAADHYDTTTSLSERRYRLGELFESAVICQIGSTADAQGLNWRFAHLRSAGGNREIDLIAELPHGDTIAVEVKMSTTITTRDARHLAALQDQLGERFRAGLIVHPGETAYRLADRIAVTPLGVLV